MIFFWSVLVKDIMDLLYWVWHTCPHYQIPSHHFRRGNTKRLLTVSLSALNTFISTAVRTHLLDTLRVPLRMNFFSIRNSLHFLLSYLRFSCICSHDGEGHHPTSREVRPVGSSSLPSASVRKHPASHLSLPLLHSCCGHWVQELVYSWSGYLKSLLKRKKNTNSLTTQWFPLNYFGASSRIFSYA